MNDEEYFAQGKARLLEYVGKVEAIIARFPDARRKQVKRMLDGPIGEQFMTSPASTRRAFHNAFPCGLIDHSLGVVEVARNLTAALAPGRWPDWKVDFCALFHDLGKAGSPGKPYYVETKENWKIKKGEFFDLSFDEWMPNAEKSLYLLQQSGVIIDHEETLAIRLNDGMGSESNREYAFREPDLALIIHWADHWRSKQEKARGLEK